MQGSRGKDSISSHPTTNYSTWFTLLNGDWMMACHCERISMLQSSLPFSQYKKYYVHTCELNSMEAKETGKKKRGELG